LTGRASPKRDLRWAKTFCAQSDSSAKMVQNPIAIIGPADLLKADALQIGALSVAELAEDVEFGARDCVEWHQASDLLLEPVLALRAAFDDTLLQLERETNPLVMRRAG
jgi:histidine phosphotransfer protein HptB